MGPRDFLGLTACHGWIIAPGFPHMEGGSWCFPSQHLFWQKLFSFRGRVSRLAYLLQWNAVHNNAALWFHYRMMRYLYQASAVPCKELDWIPDECKNFTFTEGKRGGKEEKRKKKSSTEKEMLWSREKRKYTLLWRSERTKATLSMATIFYFYFWCQIWAITRKSVKLFHAGFGAMIWKSCDWQVIANIPASLPYPDLLPQFLCRHCLKAGGWEVFSIHIPSLCCLAYLVTFEVLSFNCRKYDFM